MITKKELKIKVQFKQFINGIELIKKHFNKFYRHHSNC